MTSEKEKMLSGEMYNPEDTELLKDRNKAKGLCHKYNMLPNSEQVRRKDILKSLFKNCGEKITVEPNFFCDYGYNISAGENLYINHNCVILDCMPVEFGDNVLIGPNCGFYTAIHPVDAKERAKGKECAKSIKIGNDVWIGGNVTVLAGVTIGDKAVIGAGSVVVQDIPPNVVAMGNPCQPVREIEEL